MKQCRVEIEGSEFKGIVSEEGGRISLFRKPFIDIRNISKSIRTAKQFYLLIGGLGYYDQSANLELVRSLVTTKGNII